MKFLVFCSLVAGAFALPLNFQLTLEHFNKMCQKAQAQPKYVPQWVVGPVCGADDTAKQQAVDFINNFHAGKFPVPQNAQEFLSLVQTNVPAYADIAQNIYNEYQTRVQKLSAGAKAFVEKWEADGYKQASTDRLTWFQNVLGQAKSFIADANALSQEDWASLGEQFPEFVACWNENPKIKAFKLMMEQLPADTDFKQDQETVKRLFDMSLAEYVPKDAQEAN